MIVKMPKTLLLIKLAANEETLKANTKLAHQAKNKPRNQMLLQKNLLINQLVIVIAVSNSSLKKEPKVVDWAFLFMLP
jgi:hypothetical protein